jgi:hypothetical protein
MKGTKIIKGYLFDSPEAAQSKIDSINAAKGIPVSPDAITQTFCDYKTEDGKIFIEHSVEIEAFLGVPQTFEVTVNI